MKAAIVLFNRDLRVHDNPALAAAARAGRVVPLFVLDEAILSRALRAPTDWGYCSSRCTTSTHRSPSRRAARHPAGDVVDETLAHRP